ncbi:SGNH hydrolase-type esterase domain [Ceraceosorus bombacis]|uniref:SGNH hydrolase-type esterase domain n=1 Tax=Ceraceosorus bombacis TaxID=401625 RepID=A0A0P1BM84_9BASI|nr:SGNH hydrolase-type esterase domain [Ceraceosorus bombacis]
MKYGRIAALLVQAVTLATATPAAHVVNSSAPIGTLHIFGDSYTDSCNVWHLQHSDTPTFPGCPPPDAGRSTGERAWPEYIRIDQGQRESSTNASNPSSPGGDPVAGSKQQQWLIRNWAFSGATCDNAAFPSQAPSVVDQLALLQSGYGAVPPIGKPNAKADVALFLIGTNDVIRLASKKRGIGGLFPYNSKTTVASETACIRARIELLHELGLRRFILIENTPLQNTPVFRQLNATAEGAKYTQANNGEQKKLANDLNAQWKGNAVIDIFPAYALFDAYYRKPEEYGITNVDTPCNHTAACTTSLWQDTLHPAPRPWKIFARKLVRFVAGVRGDALIKGDEGVQ